VNVDLTLWSTSSAPADHPHNHPADGGSNEDLLVLTIDVLVPSHSARHEPNQPVGQLTVDAIPGLSLALARPAIAITVTAQPREPTPADTVNLPTTFPVLVPDPLSALAVKALAWASRHSSRDAVDVWRLLEVASAAELAPTHWSDTGVRGDARRILNADFGRRNTGGTTRATTDPTARLRIAGLVQQHVGKPTT
jgi:hypothetical protein